MTNTSTKKTVRDIFWVKEDPNGGKGRWHKVGTAFENVDSKGHSLFISTFFPAIPAGTAASPPATAPKNRST